MVDTNHKFPWVRGPGNSKESEIDSIRGGEVEYLGEKLECLGGGAAPPPPPPPNHWKLRGASVKVSMMKHHGSKEMYFCAL